MYFLLKMGIFQPAMLVYQRVTYHFLMDLNYCRICVEQYQQPKMRDRTPPEKKTVSVPDGISLDIQIPPEKLYGCFQK